MEVTVTGIDIIQKKLERYANINEKLLNIAKRLCEVGEPIIKATHGNTAQVTTKSTENGYVIQAKGKDILFIEFGTGDMAGVMDVMYDQVPPEVGMGTWSATHARMYTRYGFWVFAGEIYHYTEPHPAFYYAYEAMVQALPQIASEEFAK